MPQKDQGSFLTGFSLGLFAGAAGYFLFGTHSGKKVRQDLSKEWDQAKEKLAQDGIIDDPDASLRDVVHEFVAKIWGSQKAEKIVPSSKTVKKTKAKAKGLSNKKDFGNNKFKGV